MPYFKAKCIKFTFRWCSAPDPVGGAYSAPSDTLTVFKEPTSKGREQKGMGREDKWEEMEEKVKGFGSPKDFGVAPPM